MTATMMTTGIELVSNGVQVYLEECGDIADCYGDVVLTAPAEADDDTLVGWCEDHEAELIDEEFYTAVTREFRVAWSFKASTFRKNATDTVTMHCNVRRR